MIISDSISQYNHGWLMSLIYEIMQHVNFFLTDSYAVLLSALPAKIPQIRLLPLSYLSACLMCNKWRPIENTVVKFYVGDISTYCSFC